VIERSYPLDDESGRHLPVRLTAIDTGGEDGVTDRAYAFYRTLRQRGLSNKVMLVKGATGRAAPKLEERYPDTTKRKDRAADSRGDVPVWFLNPNTIKDIINNNIGRSEPGPGYMHWPAWLGTWFFDELTAEKRQDDGTWEKVSPRNEAFDLYAYAYAGIIRLGADKFRWDNPRPWALPWDQNPEIIAAGTDPHDQEPKPMAPTRAVRFRQRGA
jgi:phage terminase large subunit GpA-like protein